MSEQTKQALDAAKEILSKLGYRQDDPNHEIVAAIIDRAFAERPAAADEAAHKYASELQKLCDIIIGGQNVTAPFQEVEAKARQMAARYAKSKEPT